jgi:hypothetical protein
MLPAQPQGVVDRQPNTAARPLAHPVARVNPAPLASHWRQSPSEDEPFVVQDDHCPLHGPCSFTRSAFTYPCHARAKRQEAHRLAERALRANQADVTNEGGGGAVAPPPRQRRSRLTLLVRPSLSAFRVTPGHAASRPFRRFCGNEMTLPIPLPEALSITPTERPSRDLASAARSRSTSSVTASRRCSSLNGTRLGARSLKSVFLLSHAGPAEEPELNGEAARLVSSP